MYSSILGCNMLSMYKHSLYYNDATICNIQLKWKYSDVE